MEPAHVFTFFCFLLRFFVNGLSPASSTACLPSEPGTLLVEHDATGAAVTFCDSAELTLTGRERVGEGATNGSSPKNDHFLLDFVGLGVAGAIAALSPAGGMAPKKGMDPLLLGDGRGCSCSSVWVRSRIAPAVLGRDSFNFGVELKPTGEWSSRSGLVTDITDDMLPESECPGRAVIVLEVSLDTKDNGRGINSKVSEKPTLFRACGLAMGSDCGTGGKAFLLVVSLVVSVTGDFVESGSGGAVFGTRKSSLSGSIAGLAGALLPRKFWLGEGRMMEARSWLEIAADLR
jgi:hypothetical protein